MLQASYSLADEGTEFLIKDRLSFMRFLGLGLCDSAPDANTIWTFRAALTRAQIKGKPAIEVLYPLRELVTRFARLRSGCFSDGRGRCRRVFSWPRSRSVGTSRLRT